MVKIVDPDQLNQATEVVINTGAKTVQLLVAGNLDDTSPGATSGVTGQAEYSFLKEEWLVDPSLRKFNFPLKAFTKFEFLWQNGWAPADAQTRQLIRDAGWEESVGAEAGDKYACIISLGAFDTTADQASYQQTDSGTATVSTFDKTGEINEAILIYDASGPTDLTGFLRAYLRVEGKTYDEYSLLTEQGLPSLEATVYRLPLSNSIDASITDTDANVGTITPYTTVEVADYLTGDHTGITTWAATTSYVAGDIVQVGSGAYTGRYLRCTVGGTSGASAPTGAGTDGSVTWEVDPGERLIGATYYHFSRIIDANNTTNSVTRFQIHTKAQYQLRQTGNINSNTNGDGFGTVNGNVARPFTTVEGGSTIVCELGVWIDDFNTNDTNDIVFQPHAVDAVSPGRVTFPFVAAGTLAFSANVVAAADANTWFAMYFTNDDAGSNLGNDFDTSSAVIVNDNSGTAIEGQITGASIAFDYDYDNNVQRGAGSAGTDVPVTVHVLSTDGGEIQSFNFTITRTTGLDFQVGVGDERNYSNP